MNTPSKETSRPEAPLAAEPAVRAGEDLRAIDVGAHPLACALAAISIPLIWRIILVAESGRFVPHDYRGYLADIAVGTLLASILIVLSMRSRWGAALLMTLWSAFVASCYEHARVLHAWPDIANIGYLGDTTFLLGSALHLSRPWLMVFLSVAACGSVLWVHRAQRTWRWPVIAGAVSLLILITLLSLPVRMTEFTWRQTNVFGRNFLHLVGPAPDEQQAQQVCTPIEEQVERALQPDLDGTPIVELTSARPNILLIMIEGVCGAYIPTLSRYQDARSPIRMKFLDDFCQENLCYANFVTQQRQTNRGEYAIFAGDFPRLLQQPPKMSDYSSRPQQQYLPQILRREGYRTIYMQSAHLQFMMKDQFMPAAGFDECYGREAFQSAHSENDWGVDDHSFFEGAFEFVQDLASQQRPWFTAMLTLGTHHPYLVPEDFELLEGETPFHRSVRCADKAVAAFIQKLQATGALQNTVVILTSDESAGLASPVNASLQQLSHNWGFLIIKTPQHDKGFVTESFCQSDLALSILDYLGLRDEVHRVVGRSVFREYDSARPIFFGNTYQGYLGVFGIDGLVRVFTTQMNSKWQATFAPHALFNIQPATEVPGNDELLMSMARRVSQVANLE